MAPLSKKSPDFDHQSISPIALIATPLMACFFVAGSLLVVILFCACCRRKKRRSNKSITGLSVHSGGSNSSTNSCDSLCRSPTIRESSSGRGSSRSPRHHASHSNRKRVRSSKSRRRLGGNKRAAITKTTSPLVQKVKSISKPVKGQVLDKSSHLQEPLRKPKKDDDDAFIKSCAFITEKLAPIDRTVHVVPSILRPRERIVTPPIVVPRHDYIEMDRRSQTISPNSITCSRSLRSISIAKPTKDRGRRLSPTRDFSAKTTTAISSGRSVDGQGSGDSSLHTSKSDDDSRLDQVATTTATKTNKGLVTSQVGSKVKSKPRDRLVRVR